VASDADGFFAPDSTFRRVNREAVLLLGGQRALLLQLAHPLVAAGVADHSDFLAHPLRRLWRTVDTMLRIVHGDRATAEAAARALEAVHARVAGTLADATAAFPAGTAYRAEDPVLLLWVHATLVDSALVTYECFVRPLAADERERFHAESRIVARLLGVPDERLPRSYASFRGYVDEMLSGRVLEPTATARRLADAVLHPPLAFLPRLAGDVGAVVTLGLLPPVVRERYGLPWDARRERGFAAARRVVRAVLPVLPDVLRAMPQARRAERLRARPRARGA
jgi:uncharacterized protein (DUF2236 family)